MSIYEDLLTQLLNEFEKNNGHRTCPECKGSDIRLVYCPHNHLFCKECTQEFFQDIAYH